MNLYESFYNKAVLMDRKTTPDGVGGFISAWTEGASFDVAFSGLTPAEKIAAQQSAVQYSDTITTPENVHLSERDIFKVGEAVYRVVGILPAAPGVASFKFNRYTVESLPGLPT